jgi:cyclophilin family peptidyl-prolyl cis-trans isomerase
MRIPIVSSFMAFFLLVATQSATIGSQAVIKVRLGKEKEPGTIVIDLFEKDAPITVENFRKLAEAGFYKGTQIHRIFPGTMIQGGDPISKRGTSHPDLGTGGPGYTLPAEIRRKHVKGAVAMGRLPDNLNPSRASNGSQFYIALEPMPSLDAAYTVFGVVTSGLEVVESISRLPADSNDAPTVTVEILSVEFVP